jgi:hypothetical protein
MRLVLIAALLTTSAAASAQTMTPEQQAKAADAMAAMKAADKNGDGKWDLAEWKAAGRKERGFNVADTNHDGFVTPEELKAAIAKYKK